MELILKGTSLLIKGNCLIKNLEPLLESLKQMTNSERNKISLDMSQVESIDTAAIQLIAACRRDAIEKGKTFEIFSLKENVKNSFRLTGLVSILSNN